MAKISKFIASLMGKGSLVLTLLFMSAIAPISSHAHKGESHTEKKVMPSAMSDETADDDMGEPQEQMRDNISENQDPEIAQAVVTQSSGEIPIGLGEFLFSLLFLAPAGLYFYKLWR